jgi:AbrB family looped-hinge helix DNA binding protein
MPSVTVKGQVTIPKRIRERLGIRAGDEVSFVLDGERVVLEPLAREHRSFYGLLRVKCGATVAQMDAAVIDALGADDRRTRRRRKSV